LSQELRLSLRLDASLVEAFAIMTGDFSPIHMDSEFARTSRYRGRVVHGLLPVSAAMLAVSASHEASRVSNLVCRFLRPLRIGESVEIVTEGHVPQMRFKVIDSVGECATEGQIGFGLGRAAGTGAADAAGPSYGPVAELPVGDLSPGRCERLAGVGTLGGAAGFLRALAAQHPGVWPETETLDPNILGLARTSALVGMRLPGRYATFVDLEAALERGLEDDATLEGQVESVMKASGRLRLQLAWTRGGQVLGSGTAAVVVNTPVPTPLNIDAIKARHLGSGLDGRVALVAGASGGIGAATARLLAIQGAKVAVHFFRGPAAAEAVVGDILAHGGAAVAVQADLTNAAEVEGMFEMAESALGGVDILVNSAIGSFSPKPLAATRPEDFLSEVGVSLTGLHLCCARAIGHMRRQKRGKIVNIGSIATEMPPAGQIAYVSVKSALTGYTRSLAAELAQDGVQVNLVVPAMTETPLLASLPAGLVERLASESAAGRLLSPIEVARAILFLVSDASNAISGQRLVLGQGEPPYL
jgi:3-oxoacyl-[acyl-carrier protein] reductase